MSSQATGIGNLSHLPFLSRNRTSFCQLSLSLCELASDSWLADKDYGSSWPGSVSNHDSVLLGSKNSALHVLPVLWEHIISFRAYLAGSAQGLFPVLCKEHCWCGVQGIIWGTRDQSQVSFVHGKGSTSTHCTITVAFLITSVSYHLWEGCKPDIVSLPQMLPESTLLAEASHNCLLHYQPSWLLFINLPPTHSLFFEAISM